VTETESSTTYRYETQISNDFGDPVGSPAPAPASASASASGSAKNGTVPVVTPEHMLMYQSSGLLLDDHGCDDHYTYPYVIFGQHALIVNPGTPSPPTGVFGVVLYCSATSSGSGFDPNIEYASTAAILPGEANFASCYSGIANSPITESIPFGQLRSGDNLCILDGSELALVKLHSVSQTSYRVTGTVTVWQFLTSN
jgi:hypothetical protein